VLTIASYAAAACLAALVHFSPSQTPAAPAVPWVQAGRIQGYLFYYSSFGPTPPNRAWIYTHGRTPTGGTTKVLWYAPRGARWLRIRAKRLDGPGAFTDRFRVAQNWFYPSIVVVPSPGCWRLTVTSGRRYGRFAFIAIDS
jgi:hypothetical protein